MRKLLLVAASLTLLAGSAYAQGNSPYNNSGSQAGGPRGGMERAAEGRTMEQGAPMAPAARPMAPAARPMMHKRTMHKPMMRKHRMRKRTMKHHRRMRHHR